MQRGTGMREEQQGNTERGVEQNAKEKIGTVHKDESNMISYTVLTDKNLVG